MRKLAAMFVLALLFVFSCSDAPEQALPMPEAENGILDLRDHDFSRLDLLRLGGQWTFFPQQLIDPEDFSEFAESEMQSDARGFLYDVPGTWNEKEFNGHVQSGVGYGTFRLHILLPEDAPDTLGFRSMEHATAFRLFINGEEKLARGQVSSDAESGVGHGGGGHFYFATPENRELDVVLQISNYHHRRGGIWHMPVLGLPDALDAYIRNNHMIAYFALGAFFIMGIYHLILASLPPRDVSALYFSLFTFLIFVRTAVTQEKVWLQYFPDFPYTQLLQIEYISFFFGPALYVSFLVAIFPDFTHRTFLRIVYGIAVLFSLLTVILPATYFTYLALPFQGLVVLLVIYAYYVPLRAYFAGNRPALIIFAGGFFMGLTVLHDILRTHEYLQTAYAIPIGMIIFLFSQAIMLSINFARSFMTVRRLSDDLKDTNAAYSRFVPNQFLEFLNKEDITHIHLGDSTEKEMTVLFADIRSFSDLSEKMNPDENFRFINAYLKRTGPIIRKYGGFIDKYIGDAIMALFPGNAEDALKAAIEMHESVRSYNHERMREGYDPIQIGIGLHYGKLMLGTIGEAERMEGTVIADAVNIAARLEGLAGYYDTGIIASDSFLDRIDADRYRKRMLGKVRVKGKSETVSVIEIVDGRPEYQIELIEQTLPDFNNGLAAYRKGNYAEAESCFATVLEQHPGDYTAARFYQASQKRMKDIV